jgi:hypothetical protein
LNYNWALDRLERDRLMARYEAAGTALREGARNKTLTRDERIALTNERERLLKAYYEALPQVALSALPAQVEDWLETQRKALPAPAVREVDRIMAQLDQLSPQLKKLDPTSPMAEDARRLLGDHLPRLVKSYAEVPVTHRTSAEAQAHFRDGLKVVGGEIDRLTSDLARERLKALETEGRFLESRYGAKKD